MIRHQEKPNLDHLRDWLPEISTELQVAFTELQLNFSIEKADLLLFRLEQATLVICSTRFWLAEEVNSAD